MRNNGIDCLNVLALNCAQYANDQEILSQFPFEVVLHPKQYVPGQSSALIDPTDSSVYILDIKNAGSVVPESVFCLKKLQVLIIDNMAFVNGESYGQGLMIAHC